MNPDNIMVTINILVALIAFLGTVGGIVFVRAWRNIRR